ncbi:hypothetical protein F5X68DRAFT_249175 [Plectosphaerella plurivora]|uniref:IPT/TIG domain-containing protein n=1 Tax=Plectosphaerella plurivora TaxID=936078 RepID=A0A9P9A779_9PEZI|nr:hypothetical protein F5X68DRAFT_249175 [Plectosphaerella plurivora]
MDLAGLSLPIRSAFLDRRLLQRFLSLYPLLPGPRIIDFQPWSGHAGSLVVIVGRGFSEIRSQNIVTVGGHPAIVISAEENRLVVISSSKAETGSVTIALRAEPEVIREGPRPFTIIDTPSFDLQLNGPPIFSIGADKGWLSYSQSGASYFKKPDDDIPDDGPTYPVPTQEEMEMSNGQPWSTTIVVMPCYPSDQPEPSAADRQIIIDQWNLAAEFWRQATYGIWAFIPRVLDWQALAYAGSHYVDAGADQLKEGVYLDLFGNALFANRDTLDGPEFQNNRPGGFAVSYFNSGNFMRGANYGPFERLTWKVGPFTVEWNLINRPSFMYLGETARWGRMAHEVGHSMLRTDAKGLVHPEDVYGSDLVDEPEATAEGFEMMGAHDSGPLFSSYFMAQRGWYQAWDFPPNSLPVLLRSNIFTLEWKADPVGSAFSREYDVVAHGTSPNRTSSRWHIIRIKVAQGLDYFIEVREKPPSGSSQIFDANIATAGGTNGGVIVTRVASGERPLNNNQQTNLITLLHGRDRVRTLTDGEQVRDPARGIVITVVRNAVSVNPMVSRVRIEWNQAPPGENPAANMDLWIQPWDDACNSPDIWVNRWTSGGTNPPNPGWPPAVPVDNNETPIVLRVGQPWRHDFVARIRNSGTAAANNVHVVHYVNSFPTIGDNNDWEAVQAPVDSQNIGTVPANGESYSIVRWTPTANRHTCLQVHIVSQSGERWASNNMAQENIFRFDSEASSPGEPVEMLVSVRNPLKRRALIRVELDGVREGFGVYFPHRWVWLEAEGSRELTLIVVPLADIREMKKPGARRTRIRAMGFVAREYKDKNMPEWWSSIGGVTMEVTCKFGAKVVLEGKPVLDHGLLQVRGAVEPAVAGLHISVTAEKGQGGVVSAYGKTDNDGRFAVTLGYDELKDNSGISAALQATIVDSDQFVGAESNIVHWSY